MRVAERAGKREGWRRAPPLEPSSTGQRGGGGGANLQPTVTVAFSVGIAAVGHAVGRTMSAPWPGAPTPAARQRAAL